MFVNDFIKTYFANIFRAWAVNPDLPISLNLELSRRYFSLILILKNYISYEETDTHLGKALNTISMVKIHKNITSQ